MEALSTCWAFLGRWTQHSAWPMMNRRPWRLSHTRGRNYVPRVPRVPTLYHLCPPAWVLARGTIRINANWSLNIYLLRRAVLVGGGRFIGGWCVCVLGWKSCVISQPYIAMVVDNHGACELFFFKTVLVICGCCALLLSHQRRNFVHTHRDMTLTRWSGSCNNQVMR